MNLIPSTPQEEQDWHTDTLHSQQSIHQYESLTGLLLQENTPSSFNDDESYKHHPSFGYEEEMNARRERDERRRARSLWRRAFHRMKRRCCKRYDSPIAVLLVLCGVGALGALLGVMMPSSEQTNTLLEWDTISNMLGYTYFLSWTLSFYPQIITNCKRAQDAKRGVSIDFLVWNMIGFACYAAYVTSFMYSDVVRKEYSDRFGGGANGSSSSELSKLNHHHSVLADKYDVSGGLIGAASFQFVLESLGNQTALYDNSTDSMNNSTFGNNTTSNNGTATNADTNDEPIAVPQVKLNDVAFAWHALLLSIVTYVQIVCFSKDKHINEEESQNISSIECSVRQQSQVNTGWATPQSDEVFAGVNHTDITPTEDSILYNGQQQMHLRRQIQSQGVHEHLDSLVDSEHSLKYNLVSHDISCISKFMMIVLLKFCIVGVLLVLVWSQWEWIDYLYFLSFVKVFISIVKYIPQAVLNYQRKSTSGWQIWNILLDFTGGSLSVVQLIGDSIAEARAQGLQSGWRGIVGNPAKLVLGLVSIFFDIIFIVQHYILYSHKDEQRQSEDNMLDNQITHLDDYDYVAPLLPDSKDAEVTVFV